MVVGLILVPLVFACLALVIPSNRWRPWLVPAGALVHTALSAVAIFGGEPVTAFDNWFQLDALGKVFLALISVLFLVLAVYLPAYLCLRPDRSNRVMCACQLGALS